jgi:hypothetical protein
MSAVAVQAPPTAKIPAGVVARARGGEGEVVEQFSEHGEVNVVWEQRGSKLALYI